MSGECIQYNKLVRDRIPEIIQKDGRYPSTGRLDAAELESHLKLKLIEECHELFRVQTDEDFAKEIADIAEVLHSLAAARSVSWDTVEEERRRKRNERGGFDSRIFLFSVCDKRAKAHKGSEGRSGDRPDVVAPQLVTKESELSFLDIIKRETQDAVAFNVATAFYSAGMHNLLIDTLIGFTKRGGRIRLLTSIMNHFNNPDDLAILQKLVPRVELRIFYPAVRNGDRDFTVPPPPFHLKCYLFEKPNGVNSLLIGSSNLTAGGLRGNYEWNYFSNSEINAPLASERSAFQEAMIEFERYWKRDSVEFSGDFVSSYKPLWEEARNQRRKLSETLLRLSEKDVRPRPAQKEALENLESSRKRGTDKTAVVAATGLGKTYLSAFDFKNSGLRNILFIAHRENILRQALGTYRNVLEDERFGVILSGNSPPEDRARLTEGGESVFAMVQTLSKRSTLESLDRGHFDYVVIDEFHRSQANSYRKILRWFKPKFFLGLTATPERMDGRDVLEHCDGNIAYEIRLFEAIENRWLVPFQYYAIHDETDYRSLRWTSRGYVEEELTELLDSDTRAELIVRNLRKFLTSSGKIKAMAFCSSQVHARYMNRKFDEMGIAAACILGKSSPEERESVMTRLEDEEDDLEVICSVDVFGEGVDIPSVSHVLFLRPTQSFTVFLQQLGRGLRKAPEKDFVVVLDFVGNFRQSYVAPLALRGYHNVQEYIADEGRHTEKKLPALCHVSPDMEVVRVWNSELKRILRKTNRKEALRDLYYEIRDNLRDRSPAIMDFYANPAACDPDVFIKTFKGWLRAKQEMDDLDPRERDLLDTPGESFLYHLERELNPVRSYKMVVLKGLLQGSSERHGSREKTEWTVREIAERFKRYYLDHPEAREDYVDLARSEDPGGYPLKRVESHIKKMPLHFLSDKEDKFFLLDGEAGTFKLKEEIAPFWRDSFFRSLVEDRVEYALKRYFHSKRSQ